MAACSSGDIAGDLGPPSSADGGPSTTLEHADESKYQGPLTFSWPSDCTIPATGTNVKWNLDDGLIDAAVSFEFIITTSTDEELLVIRSSGFRAVAIGDLPPPVDAELLAPALLPPTFAVDPNGRLVEVRELEPLVEIYAQVGLVVADEIERTLSEYYALRVWAPWVGLWAERAVVGPEVIEVPQQDLAAATWNTTSDQPISVASATSKTGRATLFAYLPLDLGDPAAAASRVIDEIDTQALDQVGLELDGSLNFLTDTDPTTLQPTSVSVLQGVAQPDEAGTRFHREWPWEFDWEAAICETS
ncbi:hypothetical protein [Ilumatobacter sp.]|uniref:hypothetical protein n=1 Tax=Ilumatobacter sp. TaxID=1967498 RepID=UPI003AF92BD8